MTNNEQQSETAPPKSSGGIGSWIPLLVTLVAMPALAYATTMFIVLPKVQTALNGKAEPAAATAQLASDGKSAAVPAKDRQKVQFTKIIVNVAGTMGTRYLMTSVTLVGSDPNFHSVIDRHKDQLLDLASSTLRSKTISDLEKPGAANQIRTELISVFNTALGANLVQELYIPEMAIQ